MNNKKKLLIINGAQFGHSSGHYFYCKYLLDDFDIRYICYDRGLNRIRLSGVEVNYISFNGSKIFRIIRFLKECVIQSRKFKPDIIFMTYSNVCFLLALFCLSRKKVLDIRTGSLNENRILRIAENFIILFQSMFFRHVVILSESMRCRLSISLRKSRVIPLGSEVYYENAHDFKVLKLLYVGALDDRNISQTIKGLKLFLQKNGTSVVLSYSLIGFGNDGTISKLKNIISENNIGDIVKFEGRKTHEELVPYFERSNIGVVYVPLTPGYDCQPVTKLFEYLLSGMPVIATCTYENRLIVDNTNGVLIDDTPEDFCKGLEKIIDLRNYYRSSIIRQSVAKYTWEEIVNSNLKPYLLNLLQ
jgi:glycosyltransferase involved in cell wall biosynthesis